MATRLFIAGIVLLTFLSLFCLAECGGGSVSASRNGTTFSKADLAGNWERNSLGSPGPWWSRGPLTIGSDGSFTGTYNTSADSSPISASGTLSISTDGIITASSIDPSFRCVMDSGKSIVVCKSDHSGGSDIHILTKKAASYSLVDSEGTWEMNALGSPGPWWSKGPFTIGSDGSFNGTSNGSDLSSKSVSGTFHINADDTITAPSSDFPSSFSCAMDSSKSVIVCTNTTSTTAGDRTDMQILTKKAASYSLTDLKGTWEVTQFIPQDKWSGTGTMTFASDGSFTGNMGTGNDSSISGTFSITTDGSMTPLDCAMDADKSLFVCVFNTSKTNYPTMLIAIK